MIRRGPGAPPPQAAHLARVALRAPLFTSSSSPPMPRPQPAEPEHDFPPGVAAPARRALAAAGYTRLDQLAGKREAELADLHGMGPRALAAIRAALATRGKALR